MKEKKKEIKQYIIGIIAAGFVFILCAFAVIYIVFNKDRNNYPRLRDMFFTCLFIMLATSIGIVENVKGLIKCKKEK